ncbi:MAG: four helix bundle protein [Breznakibacter sp.]
MKTYRDLIAWQKAIILVSETYKATADFPKDEIYGLTNQMRRAAVSIPSNLAEGFGRNSKAEMARYANIAMGSLFELQTQLEIAKNLGYLNDQDCQSLTDLTREEERILSAFIKSIT